MPRDPGDLAPLKALLGAWSVEMTHPAFPGTVVSGRATFEWLEGEQFMLSRAVSDHPDFPDSLAVIGFPEDSLAMHYYDSRGVYRVYGMSLGEGVMELRRDAPGFSQRYTGTFSDDGTTISGLWKLSRDDETWADDLEITYRRAG